MKAQLFDKSGSKKSEIALPVIFETPIREDIVQKCVEVEKFALAQPYSHDPRAGRKHSASGTISHQRHDWKGHYGRGISRIPRKTMWRRGTQFYWIGAETTSARGGRRVHGPMLWKRQRKINSKELILAFSSALASTASKDLVKKRYSSLSEVQTAPFVIDSLPEKTKDFIKAIKSILSNAFPLALQVKVQRAGKGKLRGRKYKSNAGLLLIKSSTEKAFYSGIDVKSVKELLLSDLYPLGRLVLYTSAALNEIQKVYGENKK